MVYVSESGVLSQGPSWRAGFFVDWFWKLIDFVVLFFHTMVDPKLSKQGRNYTNGTDYRRPGQGPPRPPGRRMGGFRHGQSGPSPPPMGGG